MITPKEMAALSEAGFKNYVDRALRGVVQEMKIMAESYGGRAWLWANPPVKEVREKVLKALTDAGYTVHKRDNEIIISW